MGGEYFRIHYRGCAEDSLKFCSYDHLRLYYCIYQDLTCARGARAHGTLFGYFNVPGPTRGMSSRSLDVGILRKFARWCEYSNVAEVHEIYILM